MFESIGTAGFVVVTVSKSIAGSFHWKALNHEVADVESIKVGEGNEDSLAEAEQKAEQVVSPRFGLIGWKR
jgi:hypothetical protein